MGKRSIIRACILAFLLSLIGVQADALDYPHNSGKSIDCTSCHYIFGSEPSLILENLQVGPSSDDTKYNWLCWGCHTGAGTALYMKTHSQLSIEETEGWTVECRTCHDPHGHYQFRTYGVDTYLYQGTVASRTTTSLTSTTSDIATDYTGYILIPNLANSYFNYLITGNDTSTITVQGTIDTSQVANGDTFIIVKGELIKSTIVTPNSGTKAVKFFDSTGTNSFADGDPTDYDGVCEVCHTQTTHHRNDGSGTAQSHNDGTDCTTCHDHAKGFQVQCVICHGNPPTVGTLGGPDGLADNDGGTGSGTMGAHERHALSTELDLPCETCHTGGMPVSDVYDKKIQLGFDLFSGTYTTGTYDGRSSLANGYSYEAAAGTTINSGGTMTCSSIYCHGFTMDPNGGTDTTPVWNNSTTGACGTCHGATATDPPSLGSHTIHAGESDLDLACSICHSGYTAVHVNNEANITFSSDARVSGGSYSGTTTMLDAYGQCSSIYCHGSGSSPDWGDVGSLNCGSCHSASNATLPDSHPAHYDSSSTATASDRNPVNYSTASNYIFTCGVCHDSSTTHSSGAVSVNQAAEISFDAGIAGSGTHTPGSLAGNDNGFNYTSGTCSSTYCHSDGNGGAGNVDPQWGVTTVDCSSCHDAEPATGKHGVHTGSGSNYGFNCSQCHNTTTTNGTTIADKSVHVDKTKDVVWGSFNSDGTSYVDNATSCSNIYCHSDGTESATPYTAPNTAVQWGAATTLDCKGCHNNDVTSGSPMATGSHTTHVNDTDSEVGRDLGCIECHADTVSDNTTIATYANHVNKSIDIKVNIDDTVCSNIQCHSDGNFDGAPTYNNPTWGVDTLGCVNCHGNSSDQAYPSYADGGIGTGASNSHNKHVGSESINCGECHADTSTAGATIDGSDSTKHVNQTVDVVLQTGTYTGGTETCSSTYCHGTGTPQWGGASFNCDECHKANNTLAGAHSGHYESATVATSRTSANNSTTTEYLINCGVCHNSTSHAGGAASANQAAEMAFDTAIAGSLIAYTPGGTSAGADNGFNYTDGTCSNVYCHGDYPGSGESNTPTFLGTVACGACHNASNNADDFPTSGSHEKHVDSDNTLATVGMPTYNRGYACSLCHDGVTSGSGPTFTIADKSKHVSGNVDLAFDTSSPKLPVGTPAYSIDLSSESPTDGQGGNRAYGTCTVYCHSNVQPDGGSGAPTYDAPQWGTSVKCGTVSCHATFDLAYSHGTTISSGSHPEHIAYTLTASNDMAKCTICHQWDAATGINDCNRCHSTEEKTKHVNGQVNIVFDAAFDGGSAIYNGTTTPGDGYSSCSNTYCHGNYPGSGNAANAPTWGTAASGACGTCHGAENVEANVPASGSHLRHTGDWIYTGISNYKLNEREYKCTLCHKDIVSGTGPTYTIADNTMHVSGMVDWKFDTTDARLQLGSTPEYSIGGDPDLSGTLSPTDGTTPRAYGTCTVYCHSDVQADGGMSGPTEYDSSDPTPGQELKWGTSRGCYGCHAGKSGVPDNSNSAETRHTERMNNPLTATGSHYAHIGTSTSKNKCLNCHNWLYPDNAGGGSCFLCHLTSLLNTEKSLHVDGTIDILFNAAAVAPYGSMSAPYDSVANSSAQYNDPDTNVPGDGYNTCSNVYCHSDGTSIRKRTGVYTNTTPEWGTDGATACNSCHGTGTSQGNPDYGAPDYANSSPPAGKENSHQKHINILFPIAQQAIHHGNNTSASVCEYCHRDVTLDGTSINNTAEHADAYYRVVPYGFPPSPTMRFANRDALFLPQVSLLPPNPAGPSSCAKNTCHGRQDYYADVGYIPIKYSTNWGENVGCGDCHLVEASTGSVGEGDVDNYVWGDGTYAWIDNDQWEYSGHGKASGTYDVSGNPAAQLTGKAGGAACDQYPNDPSLEVRDCDPCLYCHDNSVDHDVDNNSTNFFRLANYDALGRGAGDEWNDVCLVCHASGSSGYDGGSGVMPTLNRTTSKAIDKYHSGVKHGAGNDGGSLCWDCHDPHGDRISGTGNIYMIHEDVTVDKADAIGVPASTASPVFIADADGSDYAKNIAPYDGICNVCHTQTDYHRNDTSGANEHDHNLVPTDNKCTDCHTHSGDTTVNGDAFKFGASGPGHDTHLNGTNGPGIDCVDCHGSCSPPEFRNVADTLCESRAATDICDSCHSPGGAFDGVDDAVIGAKNNWPDGVYTGSVLTAGKEKWCVGCHDDSPSVISSVTAPNVAGNYDQDYGFYVSGHGVESQECGACHDLSKTHIDGDDQTYAVGGTSYKEGYRLADVGGQDPMNIPNALDGCGYDADDYRLCFSCHNEQALIQDSKADSMYECVTNPYLNAASITTNFRNEAFPEGVNAGASDVPANIHWDHLVDIHTFGTNVWDSDGDGGRDSEATCVTCHNPHGDGRISNASQTKKMTRASLDIVWGTDATGDYGGDGPDANFPCWNCHGGGGDYGKYYRTAQYPTLDSISITDNDSSDPAAADPDFTNSTSVEITITNSGVAPTEMIFAENDTFTSNSTGWIPYANPYTYTLSAGEVSKTVYGRLRYGSNRSGVQSDSITLDETDPVVGSSAVTSPNNGTEVWTQDTLYDITWTPAAITDDNLKGAPLSFSYSTDSGNNFPNAIASDEANDGTYQWSVAPVESTNVRVQLTATDRAGNQASDSSDNDFSIEPVAAAGISGITVSDNDPNDNNGVAADPDFTNDRTVAVSLSVSNNPTQMMLAEDSGFSVNSSGWIPFSATTTHTICSTNCGTVLDGDHTIYAKVKNMLGESASWESDTITLDRVVPSVLSNTLTAPNGHAVPLNAEYWPINSSQTITWNIGGITDNNLKGDPIGFKYSMNSGSSYTTTIATDEANDGAYTWNPLPSTVRTTARVQLIATDKAGNQSTDESDNDFKISPPYKFIVTDTGDTNTLGTLRYALNNLEDNAIIWFRIASTTNQVAEITIDPANGSLPVINNAGVTIDGDTQEQLVGNSNPNGPEVRIIKAAGVAVNALDFNADDGWIENLQIGGFNYAVRSDAENFVVLGCHLGFASDSTGYSTDTAYRNTYGISLLSNSQYAYIGSGGANKNYISCSSSTGIMDRGSNNSFDSNILGILPDDATVCRNTSINIDMASSTYSDVQRSVICGDSTYGLYIDNTDNLIFRGNQIGVSYDGIGDNWIDCADPANAIYINGSSGNANNVIGGQNVALSDSNLRDSNVIDPGSSYGLRIRLTSSVGIPTKIYGNFFGTNPEEDETFPGDYAIYISESSSGAANIGGYDTGEAGNVIANMSTKGVYVDSGATPADYIGINRNSFYNNGSEAALSDDGIFIGTGDNGNIAASRPVIDSATTTQVTVSNVASGNVVEVYLSDYDGSGSEYGEGRTYLASATAGGTSVNVDVSGAGLSIGDWLTVTKTIEVSGKRRTSNFSANGRIPGAAVPTLDWTGEANYTTDGVDPDSAQSGSDYTFRVKYTDADNDLPVIIEVWIDENDNSSYETDEKYAMTEVDSGDTDYTDGKLYTITKPILAAGDGILIYRFYATDGASAATGSPASDKPFTVQLCTNLDVDPSGTYFEAESFTSTIVQGSATFDEESSVAGYNGTAYLIGNGTNTTIIPPTEEGKQYILNFPTTGNYRVWLRGRSDSSGTDSIFIGLDGSRTGYLFTGYEHNTWKWISSTQPGQPGTGTYYIDPGTTGFHTFNIWFREDNFKIDAIYLTQGAETPDDGTVPSGSSVIVPSVCMDSNATVAGTATASMASTTSIDVSMPYTFDNDNDNTYTVDYKLSSEPVVWTNWVTSAANTASPYTDTITGLTPSESYDVRMTYNDADGVGGTNPQTVSGIVLPVDATTVGTATAYMASVTSIDVSMPYTDDGNANNTYTVDYKLSSEPTVWTNWVTNAAHSASPYTDTITGLTAGETYDVRMTYNDADTVSGNNPQTLSSIILDYVVTNVNDSGGGSLRQVLTVLIAAGGSDTVTFDVPLGLLTNGVAVIDVATDLPEITANSITIDGGSQTTNRGDTNLNGPEVRINKAGTSTTGFNISGDSVYLEKLQITGFTTGVSGSSSALDTSMEYNQLGFYSDSSGYGSSPNGTNAYLSGTWPNVFNGNYFACATNTGLNISDSSDAYVDENVFGMYPDGTSCPNVTYTIRVGGTAADAGITDNIISGSTYGIYLDGSSSDTIIRGNQIGVKYTGVVPTGSWTDLPGPTYGIYMTSGSSGNNTIGGSLVAIDDDTLRNSNVIGATSYGIYVYDQLNYTTNIHGNFIGTNPDGGDVFSGSWGILVRYLYGVTIGGADAGEAGNVIANMTSYGVELYNSNARYVDISRNSFYNNGSDTGDDAIFLDDGNSSITRPTIGSASTTTVTVNGVDGGNGGTQAGDIVEVYIADFAGTEYGEGKTFVGSAVVTQGQTSVDVPVSGVSSGQWVTATRTNHYTTTPVYQTSAFSANVQVP